MQKKSRNTGEKYLAAFLLGFCVMLVTVIPVMICENGYFIYYGDFNSQQIPFYNLANDAVRNGGFGWNWYTDLGSDLITSYSFYLIGSPFFWLTVLLPRFLVTFSMPVVLSLKHGIAALTAYIYIRKFVRSKELSLVGAMLYTFSGFQIFNLFFNHFQDVTAVFPLMLIAMEEHINCRKRGFFALTVALSAFINYYFFAGEAVFLVIYFLFRLPAPDFHSTWKKFFSLCFEAIVGTALSMVILLPSAMLIIGNERVSQHLFGTDIVIYFDNTLIPRLIQTFFMPVDIPARPNLFQSDYEKWASIGGYFPLFSTLGIITFLRTRKSHWASRLTITLAVFALIPILNSLFQAANSYYYARWFFMPLLILAMMTAQTLDTEGADFKAAFRVNILMLAGFTVVAVYPDMGSDGKLKWLGTPRDPIYFFVTLAIAAVFLFGAHLLLRRKAAGKPFQECAVWCTAFASVMCIFAVTLYGAVTPADAKKYINININGNDELAEEVSGDNFFRIDSTTNIENAAMIWQIPSMRAFQSVVEPSIMEFYKAVGVQRDVASRADVSHYTLRGLLSVKYFYREINDGYSYAEITADDYSAPESSASNSLNGSEPDPAKVDITKYMPGFRLLKVTDKYEIYENTLYVPMGMGFDCYMTESQAEKLSKGLREKSLMKALVLTDEQAERFSGILTPLPKEYSSSVSKTAYERFCREKQENCTSSFSYDSHGFQAEFDSKKEQLVFFSVPYSTGWSAEVNGEPVDVEKVSYGFMAVPVSEGHSSIVFRYHTPWLREGAAVSIVAAIVLAVYIVVCRKKGIPEEIADHKHYYDYDSTARFKL